MAVVELVNRAGMQRPGRVEAAASLVGVGGEIHPAVGGESRGVRVGVGVGLAGYELGGEYPRAAAWRIERPQSQPRPMPLEQGDVAVV